MSLAKYIATAVTSAIAFLAFAGTTACILNRHWPGAAICTTIGSLALAWVIRDVRQAVKARG